jgi:hypothetical protein
VSRTDIHICPFAKTSNHALSGTVYQKHLRHNKRQITDIHKSILGLFCISTVYTSLKANAIKLLVYMLEHVLWGNIATYRSVKVMSPYFNASMRIPRHARWAPCHHGMARPQVAHGGDGLQMWRVAASILNKQSRRAKKEWSS